MKISYVTPWDATDVTSWSGTVYSIAKMLEGQDAEMEYVDKLHRKSNLVLKLKREWYKRVHHKIFDVAREPYLINEFANQIAARLNSTTDLIFCPSSTPIALLETNKPKVFYTDATFAGLVNFYDTFSNYCDETVRHANLMEQKSLESCSLAIYSSEWAAQTALKYYNVQSEKVKVVPFGANIVCDRTLSDIHSIVDNRPTDRLDLLFLGVEWIRKGADKALKIAVELNRMGIKTHLHLVGIKEIPLTDLPECIVNHGHISKSTDQGVAQIEKLLSSCHFLLLPTVADCTPMVYAEANSYGLPCMTTDVGGIGSIITNDANGKLFQLNADIEIWCNEIATVFSDKPRYKALCLSSFHEYQSKLNWDVAGKRIMKLMRDL